jgi:hypothetical protein
MFVPGDAWELRLPLRLMVPVLLKLNIPPAEDDWSETVETLLLTKTLEVAPPAAADMEKAETKSGPLPPFAPMSPLLVLRVTVPAIILPGAAASNMVAPVPVADRIVVVPGEIALNMSWLIVIDPLFLILNVPLALEDKIESA